MADTGPRPESAYRVLIAGGGVAALEAMLALRDLAEERVDLELLAPETRFWYRPLAVAEPFGLGQSHHFELADLVETVGASFTLGALAEVDARAKVARTDARLELEYDALLIALGARPAVAVPGALTFRGPADTERMHGLLDELEAGSVRRIVFAVPGGLSWPLPAYELALLTAAFAQARGAKAAEIALVTPETAPLALFGPEAGSALQALFEERGIAVRTESYPDAFESGTLRLVPDGELSADAVVALPKLTGPALAGIPQDASGFIPTDENGRVAGADDVYAAGDATAFPIKQGGIATQQADAAAETIAAAAGAPVEPQPFRAVLRGLLLTGSIPRFLRTDLSQWREGAFRMDTDPLWWPPAKISGRYLGPFLAEHAGYVDLSGPPEHAIPVEIDLSAKIQTIV
ncbi:MAG TPA: FAD-dependent oxidoreductase [Gaiellaceae bacterium]|nr:FAD-dependent oxidoreductase [Gaiellaceae bacterium]